jgi:hypothetical protein
MRGYGGDPTIAIYEEIPELYTLNPDAEDAEKLIKTLTV